MDRPLVWIAAGLTLGMFAAAFGAAWFVGALALLTGLLAAAMRNHFAYRQHFIFGIVFYSLGGLVWGLEHRQAAGDALSRYSRAHPLEELGLEGEVRQAPVFASERGYATFILAVDYVATPHGAVFAPGRLLVRWTDPAPVHSGERVRVRGKIGHRLGPVNHGVRGYEDYLRTQGVHSEIRVRGPALERLSVPVWSPYYWVSRLRTAEARALQRAVPGDVLPFVLAVWLGERSDITEEQNEAFIASGTAHILSVSGVHVAIVFASIQFLLQPLLPSRRARAWLGMVAVLVFALATGARVATFRSALMVEMYLVAELLRREPDPATAISVAALLFLLAVPDWLFDAGFLLSFASVSSLLIFAPALDTLLESVPNPVRHALAPTFAVQLLPLPLALHFFHVLPLAAPLGNLLILPLLGAVLWLAFATVVLGFLLPPAALLLGHALAPFVWTIDWVAAQVAALPFSHFIVTDPTPLAAAAYYVAAAGFLGYCLRAGARKKWLVGTGAAATAAVLLWSPWTAQAEVDFLDVGHGDCTLLRTGDGKTLLVDGGDTSEYGDTGKRVILPFLYTNQVDHLDMVVATHADRDHMGGLLSVVQRMPVGEVLLGPESGEPLETLFLSECAAAEVPVRRVYAGETLHLGTASLEVLHPPKDWRPDLSENEHSVVLRVRWEGPDLLLSGDVEVEAERLLSSADCRAAVLKAPHHGSDTSSSSAFLRAVAPGLAVMSVLPRGHYHTADPEVIARYRSLGIQLWRTDLHGGIRLRPARQGVEVSSARAERGLTLSD